MSYETAVVTICAIFHTTVVAIVALVFAFD